MTIRLRVLPRFPANISGGSGLTVDREGVDLVVALNYEDLVQVASVIDPDTSFFALWNSGDDSYLRMSFNDVFDAVSGLGFMQTSVYDPTGIEGDVFNRANHYGTNTPTDGTVTTAKIADANVTTAKIADANVTNAKLANMAAATVKGRALGAGTGAPTDLDAAALRAIVAPYYESAATTVTLGTPFTVAHGLSVSPRRVETWLRCSTANNGYSVGDTLPVCLTFSSTNMGFGFVVVPDGTNVTVIPGNAGLGVISPKGGGNVFTATAAQWQVIIKAWSF